MSVKGTPHWSEMMQELTRPRPGICDTMPRQIITTGGAKKVDTFLSITSSGPNIIAAEQSTESPFPRTSHAHARAHAHAHVLSFEHDPIPTRVCVAAQLKPFVLVARHHVDHHGNHEPCSVGADIAVSAPHYTSHYIVPCSLGGAMRPDGNRPFNPRFRVPSHRALEHEMGICQCRGAQRYQRNV
jgi:hypothetical protein